MENAATTIRLDPDLKRGLLNLTKIRAISLNKLVDAALRDFFWKELKALQAEFDTTILDLQRCVAADPNFDRAIERIAASEAALLEDPAQGVVHLPGSQPATEAIRGLLSA